MEIYDKYYREGYCFGEPYRQLIEFFEKLPSRGMLCDLGAGQGRDSIPLANMGYEVSAVDVSEVGIKQIKSVDSNIHGIVADIYTFPVNNFDIVLMDSMLHFYKNDYEKEKQLVERICSELKDGALFANCLLKSKKNEKLLKKIIEDSGIMFEILVEEYADYPEADCQFHFLVIQKVK